MPVLITKRRKVRVTTMAVNSDTRMPMASVSAKPLMTEDENQYSTTHEINVVVLPSRIEGQARRNASSSAAV